MSINYEQLESKCQMLEAELEALKKAVVIASELPAIYSLYDIAVDTLSQADAYSPARRDEILKYFPVLIRALEES